MFNGVADLLDKRRAHMAVDHAMVERARYIHHLSAPNLVVPDDRTLLDLVDGQDGDLGPVDDRRCEDAPFLAERRDREGGALDVLEGEFLVPRGRSQPLDFFREVPQALLVGLVDDRDREAFVRGGRDSDVVVSLDHDLSSLVVDGGVQVRELHERREDRFDEKGQEGQLDSLAVRGRFQVIAQVDQLRHVDLLDVCEVGRRDVGFRHLLEDSLPQPVDRDSLLAAARGGRCRWRRCDNGRPRGAVRGLADVILAEAALRTAPSDRREIHVQFLREATDRGRREDISGRTGRGWRLRPCRRRWWGDWFGGFGPGRDGLARLPEHDEGAADLHDFALFRAKLK